jgi:TolB-like protein/DNA-binding winged helix-turn-helix (wHTH) protein/Tfp pilus assembly protein PilF
VIDCRGPWVPMPENHQTSVIQFGVFQANLDSGELFKQGLQIKLQKQPFEVLKALVERPGELVTREELRSKLWGADTFVDFDRALNKAVTAVRDALGDSADNPRFLETLPKRGYRFIAPVSVRAANGITDSDLHRPPDPPQNPAGLPPSLGSHRWSRSIAAICALVLVTVLFAGYVFQILTRAGVAPIRSIAVLPLRSISGDSAEERFADAMTDELITLIGAIGPVRVIGSTSTMRYKQSSKTAEEIARELNVDAFVQGTVLREADRIRINMRLTSVRPESQLWTQSYHRDLQNILELQAELARSIAENIQIRLTPKQSRMLARAKPVRPDAYEAYIKGRYFWNKRTEQGFANAVEYFQQAIGLDPNYAAAYAGLADSYLINYSGAVAPESMAKGRAAAITAVRLDSESAEAHTCLGRAKLFGDWDWSGAEEEFKRAISLNPNYATAHQWYGLYFSIMRRHNEAASEFERARNLDPVSAAANAHVGLGYYFARDYEKAIRAFRSTLELEPGFNFARRWLGLSYLRKGMLDAGLRECTLASEQGSGGWLALGALTYAQAVAGQREKAIAGMEQLQRLSQKTYVAPYLRATIYMALGERELAFEWLRKALDERSSALPFIQVHGWFDELRSDERFADLVRQIGLPQ